MRISNDRIYNSGGVISHDGCKTNWTCSDLMSDFIEPDNVKPKSYDYWLTRVKKRARITELHIYICFVYFDSQSLTGQDNAIY